MDREQEFNCVMPFWIDTDAYTPRDQEMFCAGYEFCQMYERMKLPAAYSTTIHRENESRFRMMAGRMKRQVKIEPCETEHDPDGTWSYFDMEEVE